MAAGASRRDALVVGGLAIASWTAYLAIYLPYLPGANGHGGADYGYFLTQLLSGYFWFTQNGLFSVPWFTPAFCAGIPLYPNMQAMYFSAPQFLTFVVGPAQAVQLTLGLFAALGLSGFYVLLRRVFATGQWTALAGGVLFLFNGLFVTRVLVGHFAFHAFMLAPLLAVCVMVGRRPDRPMRMFDVWVLMGGLIVGYMVQSGMVHAFPIVIVGLIIFILVDGMMRGLDRVFLIRLALVLGIGLALSLAKIVAALAFMSLFPREMIPLSGFESLTRTIAIGLKALFVGPPFADGTQSLTNNQWFPDSKVFLPYHEYSYGITFVPLLAILAWMIVKGRGLLYGQAAPRMSRANVAMAASIAVLLTLPIALNWYEPGWNAFLKQLPVIRNSSTLVRWYSLYILFFILITALIIDRMKMEPAARPASAIVVVAVVIGLNIASDRSYYPVRNTYDFAPVTGAYQAVSSGRPVPTVDRVDWLPRSAVAFWAPPQRNDSLVTGGSQGLCYEPMFGHRLEEYPFGPLREGPTMQARDGLFNIKNPACLLFPRENSCKAGDHFSVNQRVQAENFVNYRPFEFAMPWWQHAANWLNLVALVMVVAGTAFFAGRWAHARYRRPSHGGGRVKQRAGSP